MEIETTRTGKVKAIKIGETRIPLKKNRMFSMSDKDKLKQLETTGQFLEEYFNF